MRLPLALHVRGHHNGLSSVEVLGRDGFRVVAPTVEEASTDLALVISEEIERTHPADQAAFVLGGEARLERLTLPGLLRVGEETRDLVLGVIITEQRGWQSLYVPRVPFFAWAPKKSDWREALAPLLIQHLAQRPAWALLELRPTPVERLDTIEIAAEPPPLSAFRGKNRHLRRLPLAFEIEEAETDQKAAKNKRPPTPVLEELGTPLTKLAERGRLERAFGREGALADLLGLLTQKGEKALALVGDASVGKSAVLEELVFRLAEAPEPLASRPVWFVDASRLVAVEGFFGEWQRQTLDVVAECEAAKVIWYVGELPPLLDAGKHIGSDHNVAAVLKPFLAGKRITVLGECRTAEWSKLELKDPAFARLFTPVRLEEPAQADARATLEQVASTLAERHGVTVQPDALEAVERLSRRYAAGASASGSALLFFRRLFEHASKRGQAALGRHHVEAFFARETGIPELLLSDRLPLRPEVVQRHFEGRLVGQAHALSRMGDLVAVIKAGLSDLSRPLGSFLFVGPTGVGKTETAKALASFLFGHESRLLRFDMSEFAGWDAVTRFLGDAQTEGKLVEGIRRAPFSVVLLDELEKAHPAIFDLLLQLLGEGRLTDESGRTASFANAVVIMTSNLGVDTWRGRLGFAGAGERDAYRGHFVREVERFFRPELVNRIDHLVVFEPLEAEAIRAITQRELARLARRAGLAQRGIELQVAPEVEARLAAEGVDIRYGARPLKRTLERRLVAPLARWLGARNLERVAVRADLEGDDIGFSLARGAEAASEGAREQLARLAEHAERLRYWWSRWRDGIDHRELKDEVRLVEQLTRSKAFFANRSLAGYERKQELIAEVRATGQRLEQAQDLLHEAYRERDTTVVAMVEEELNGQRAALEVLAVRLYGRRFAMSREVRLLLAASSSGAQALERLAKAYVVLGRKRGLTVRLDRATRAPTKEEAGYAVVLKSLGKQGRSHEIVAFLVSELKQGRSAAERLLRELPHQLERGLPHQQAQQLLRRLSKLGAEVELESPDELRQGPEPVTWVQEELSTPPEGDPLEPPALEAIGQRDVLSLTFEGEGARPLFAQEVGRHLFSAGGDNAEVYVWIHDGGLGSTLPAAPVLARTRVVNEREHKVQDLALERHVTAEPRLWKSYETLQMLRLYAAALGRESLAWAEALDRR